MAGESPLFVGPAEIPAHDDVARLGQALAVLAGDYELMACFAAYTGGKDHRNLPGLDH